jgi:hypothetical protein
MYVFALFCQNRMVFSLKENIMEQPQLTFTVLVCECRITN